jgi:preprotein translocase subunit SecG
MLLGILLAILIVVCLALIGVILLQRSEGGALGMSGGGPGAFMTARGTGDLLTRTTQILAGVFFALCLAMTLISGHERNAAALIEKVKGLTPLSSAPASSAPAAPAGPLGPAAPLGPTPAGPASPFSAPSPGNGLNLLGSPQVPLAAPPKPVPAVRLAKAKPVRAAPEATTAPAPAPAAAPAPPLVTVPPPAPAPAPAAPTNGQ